MKRSETVAVGGMIAAAITPRRSGDLNIDLGSVLELIDFLCAHKVNGIALLGSTGEFLHYSLDDRSRLISLAVRRSRVPVLVNVSHSHLDGAVLLAEAAAKAGAAGVLLMPPYYFRYGQDTIRAWYLAFAEAYDQAPVYLYNIPFFTSEISLETTIDLLQTGSFAGIKDSSGSWDYFTAIRGLAQAAPVTFLVGNDRIFARARGEGAQGAVSGVACALPELMTALDGAIAAGDTTLTARLEGLVHEFLDQIDPFPVPLGIKEALRIRGVKSGAPAAPLSCAQAHRLALFRDWFSSWVKHVAG